MKKVTALFLVVVMVTALFVFTASAEKFKVTTQTDPLRVRDKAYGGDVIGLLPKGTVVEGTRVDNWKVMITYNGQTAYIYSGYLTPVDSSSTTSTTTKPETTTKPTTSKPTTTTSTYSQPYVSEAAKDYASLCYRISNAERLLPEEGELYQVSIKRDTVRIWSKKSMDERWSRVLIKLPNNVFVKVVEKGEEWSKIFFTTNKAGYVYTKYLVEVTEDMVDEPIEIVDVGPATNPQE